MKSSPVRTDKIILPDRVLTEKQEIKDHIRTHFKTWTRTNPPSTDPALIREWEDSYQLINSIHGRIYSTILDPISLEELESTIQFAPKGNTPGPLTITNEVLQHLPTSAKRNLLLILNTCLQLNKVPNQWLRANIWPIPKKPNYNYDLTTTRPITLIDHTRKVFTKILNNRLTPIIMRNNILSNNNFAAFPYQSTILPILQLGQILEDATTNNKELWILSQDMSKAFDSVHINTLARAL